MSRHPSLCQLCLAGGSHPLALVADQTRTGNDLRRAALALAAGLRQRPEQTWALWLTSPYEFLCSFMALVLAGKRILLPANMQAQTAHQLAAQFDGLISRSGLSLLGCLCLTPEQVSVDPAQDFEPDTREPGSQDIEILLFTSGSTGEPQAVVKTLALLEAELAILQQHWGAALGDLPVLASVSHQHIYGLLHLVLWPLVRGAAFVDEVCQYPEEILARAQQLAPVVLVSSPTHLKRLPLSSDFMPLHGAIHQIVSSAGLLGTDTAFTLAETMGKAPLEILGSTETGGVAWRQQDQSQNWQALPGVKCKRDEHSGCLAVQSQHLGKLLTDENGWYLMGDKVELQADGSFSLLGRVDSIVKVEGKRLSLTEMESRLQEHPLIEQARIALVQGKREEVGAAVVLSVEGQLQLAQAGKRALNQQLRDYLLTFFERPLLPRRWRYLSELPVNAQGKVVLADLQALLLQRET